MAWIAAGAAVVGGLISSRGAKKAAETSSSGGVEATAEQRRQFDLTRQDFAPYRETGVNALKQLEAEINQPVSAQDVMSDPGYQFGLQQGQQALDRKIAAMGGRVSGAAIKAAGRFGTDYASSGFNAAYQRRQDRLNRLAALAGVGQSATGSSAAAGAQSSNAISSLLQNRANTQAASQLAQSNIWGDAVKQFGAIAAKKWGDGE